MEGRAPGAAEPVPDRFWDLYSRYYDAVRHVMPYRKLLWDVYQALELRPGMQVLDAGCGTGNFEAFLQEKQAPAVAIEALDFSEAMLQIAREKVGALPSVRFVRGDLDSPLPYLDGAFDRILSINVLYALEDWDRTVRELLRVLKPGGRMVITTSAPDFRFVPLLVDHFRRVGNIWGFRRQARTVLRSLGVFSTMGLGSLALNVLVINRREGQGRYRSLDRDDMHAFLAGHRENGLDEFSIEPALADQNLLATATKVSPAYAS